MIKSGCRVPGLLMSLCLLPFLAAAPEPEYFRITVLDEKTGRGVPLVELTTVNHLQYVTDSNGIVAFREPGLMNQRVFFHVKSHGYEFPKDGFGCRGRALDVTVGGSATLRIRRLNVAERLYRQTGGGIYADSLLVGAQTPLREPVLNGQVFGSDSVVNATYQGKIYWFWGDTNRPAYPLGNFNVPGATSRLPEQGGLNPSAGVDFTYFLDDKGFARPMAKMPGQGPTWIDSLVTLKDADGRERMYASYVKVRGQLDVYARGLARFNDAAQEFEKLVDLPLNAPLLPGGHPFQHTVGGVEYIYFPQPYPLVRVRASVDHLKNPNDYEAFTCLMEGSSEKEPRLDRSEAGMLRYAWKKNTPPLGQKRERQLVSEGKLKRREALLHLQDVDSGKPVLAHRGSVYWNAHRGRWIMILVEEGGTSYLGEVWYAEADTPVGPWVYARKVVTHDRQSFYNPKQHPFFDQEGGRIIYFEGTYTQTFSGNPVATPRYEYNQVLYKLDLDDARLVLPVPIYRWAAEGRESYGPRSAKRGVPRGAEIAFLALDRPKPGAVPLYEVDAAAGPRLHVGELPAGSEKARKVCYILPADVSDTPATTVLLHEFTAEDGDRRIYAPAGHAPAGYRKNMKPLGRVWPCPLAALPPGE